jgi:hypothetical protein
MLKEIQDELKSISSAAEVPKEAGQSLASRAAPPAAKPAPIIGACFIFICAFAVVILSVSLRSWLVLFTLLFAVQAPMAVRQRTSGQPYPLISGGFSGGL